MWPLTVKEGSPAPCLKILTLALPCIPVFLPLLRLGTLLTIAPTPDTVSGRLRHSQPLYLSSVLSPHPTGKPLPDFGAENGGGLCEKAEPTLSTAGSLWASSAGALIVEHWLCSPTASASHSGCVQCALARAQAPSTRLVVKETHVTLDQAVLSACPIQAGGSLLESPWAMWGYT